MNKVRKLSMRGKLLSAIACAAISIPSYAQVYLQDYTSLHVDPNKKQWVVQDAIYRDDNEKAYYVAQQLRPVDSKESYLGITKCDPDMKVITTWEYYNDSKKMSVKTETIDEMYGYNALILVGHYEDHSSNLSEPFVMSVDKFSGAVNWFKFFPGLELTSLEAEKDFVIVTGSRALPYNDGIYPYSGSAAIIMRLDKNGDLVWEREFEDDKYASSDYGPKYVYNILNDVKRIDDKYFVAVGNTNNWIFKEQPQNLWDADGLVVMIDYDGNINYSVFLGNILPMSSNGQQAIQYELMDHLTFDPKDKTVVIAGERLDNPQNYVSDQSPTPDQWGLWVTKLDPYSLSIGWTYRYQYKDKFYRITDPEIEHDTWAQYGISYNFDPFNTIAMKLKNSGSVIYHRYHFVSSIEEKALNDIVKAFEYNNMTIVGQITPDPDRYNSSYGWNIQAFDNILDKCEMEDYDIEQKEVKFDIDKVENRKYKVEGIDENMNQQDYELLNRVLCEKKQVGFKSTPDTKDITSNVTQDVENSTVTIQIQKSSIAQNVESTYTAVLYNALGQKIMETASFSNNYKMNIAGLASGIYYLHVSGSNLQEAHTILVK